MNTFKLLDVVALLKDIPEHKLLKGQVGTIIETLQNNTFEVEFSSNTGEAIATIPVKAESLLLLHYEAELSIAAYLPAEALLHLVAVTYAKLMRYIP